MTQEYVYTVAAKPIVAGNIVFLMTAFCMSDIDDFLGEILLSSASNGSSGWVVLVSASQPKGREFKLYKGHDHDFSYGTCTGWLQTPDSFI